MNLNAALKTALSVLLLGCFCNEGRCSEPLNTVVAKEGFAATYYAPPEDQKPVGVIVLGGSEGGTPHRRAQAFAQEGYAAMALAYFKAPGTPETLDEIPLEYFDKPIEWFAGRPEMEGRKIVLVGGSKGGELALLLASRKKQIHGVIAISPSSVIFQGIPKVFWPPRSSWTSHGDPLPFVAYDISKGVDPQHLRPLYEQSLSHADQVAKAAIPVEKINGPVLLLSGEHDRMWPASDMAEAMIERLTKEEFPHTFEHIQYANAGHTLNEFYMIGGTEEGNRKARLESNQKIVDFLSHEFALKKMPRARD